MSDFKQNFNSFRSCFKDSNHLDCNSFLSICFEIDPKTTLLKLYDSRYLANIPLLKCVVDSKKLPEHYRILLSMLILSEQEINDNSLFLLSYSKLQILQTAARLLEKDNAELKYNERWNIKYNGGDSAYLEAERQSNFLTKVGIAFQELLNRFYFQRNEDDSTISKIDEDSLDLLICSLLRYNEVKDTVERHLYFDWHLEVEGGDALRTFAPDGQKEGTSEQDFNTFRKLKFTSENIEDIAFQNLMKEYESGLTAEKKSFKLFHGFLQTLKSAAEIEWYKHAFELDVLADTDVERELASFKNNYFPDSENAAELRLKDNTALPLRPTFRILRFISELSKEKIILIDSEFSNAINDYSRTHPISDELRIIELESLLSKNDKKHLRDVISKNYNEEVLKEQENILRYAKSKISDQNCLIKIETQKLVNTIHRIHNYTSEFVEQVIDIFTYHGENNDVTRSPFFKIGKHLYWMPNSVAYVSFAENLIQNLISSNLVTIHTIQTELYEKSLNYQFLKHGYKVILLKEDKKIRDSLGKELGDFDLLAYKNGTLIFIEVKLTNARNTYKERKNWRDGKLNDAQNQLKVGIDYIKENPAYISKILGLFDNEHITKIAPFIASNSFIYDHDKIETFLKVSYTEIIHTLISSQDVDNDNRNDVDVFIDRLNNNWLFKKWDEIPFIHYENVLDIGGYKIIRSGLVQQNMYTSL